MCNLEKELAKNYYNRHFYDNSYTSKEYFEWRKFRRVRWTCPNEFRMFAWFFYPLLNVHCVKELHFKCKLKKLENNLPMNALLLYK